MSRSIRFVAALTLASLAGACATAKPGAERVQVSGNAEMVKGCVFLQQIRGGSIIYTGSGLAADAGMEDGYTDLRNKAIDLGGTNVITLSINPGPGGLGIVGDVYRCAR